MSFSRSERKRLIPWALITLAVLTMSDAIDVWLKSYNTTTIFIIGLALFIIALYFFEVRL